MKCNCNNKIACTDRSWHHQTKIECKIEKPFQHWHGWAAMKMTVSIINRMNQLKSGKLNSQMIVLKSCCSSHVLLYERGKNADTHTHVKIISKCMLNTAWHLEFSNRFRAHQHSLTILYAYIPPFLMFSSKIQIILHVSALDTHSVYLLCNTPV